MGIRIRLSCAGRTNRMFYRLVVANAKSPRDGRCVEKVGYLNPHIKDGFNINVERVLYWFGVGAVFTEKARAFVKRKSPELMSKILDVEMERRRKKCCRGRSSSLKRNV